MGKILSGKEPAKEILNNIKARIDELGRPPYLAIMQVGENPASTQYVGMKLRRAESVGMRAELHKLPADCTMEELLSTINSLNHDTAVDGFIVQLPLPRQLDEAHAVEAVSPGKDVDGLTSTNLGLLFQGREEGALLPATPSGIMKILEHYEIPIKGRHAVIIGRSNLVGRPAAALLLNRDATVTICHSKTLNLAKHTQEADILIAAVGKPGLVTADMVKDGAAVIDVGTTKVKDGTLGDVDYADVIKKADCSPVPGGVGPMTVAMLLENTTKAAERKKG